MTFLATAAPIGAAVLLSGVRGMNNDLTGVWFGEYHYTNGDSLINFMLNIDECGIHFDGRMDESNSFGGLNGARILAHIEGARSGKNIFFTKTSDSTTRARNLVSYTGRLTLGGNRIEGNWSADGRNGRFAMNRPLIANDYIEAEAAISVDG